MAETTIDLSAIKSKIETSAAKFSSLASTFNVQAASAISYVTPALKNLGNALPDMAASMSRAAASIGSSIMGASAAAIPKMMGMMQNLIPNTDKIQSLCTTALNGISKGIISGVSGLKDTITGLAKEASIIAETAKLVIKPEIKADPELTNLSKEVSDIANTLANYANDMGKYLFNPSGGESPHFSKVLSNINIEQLQTSAENMKNSAVDLASGVVSANLYKAVGIMREVGIRRFNKSFLYQQAELQYGQSSAEVSGEVGKDLNMLRGATPEQNNGI